MESGLNDFRLVTIGAGKMGSALTTGVREGTDIFDCVCLDRDPREAERLAKAVGGRAPGDKQLDFSGDRRSIILLAVKPTDIESALSDYSDQFHSSDILISIAAGVEHSEVQSYLPVDMAVIRAMPNVSASVGRGVTGVFGADQEALEVSTALFESVGTVVELSDEEHFDALTAVSGSGPAYVFTAIEAMADGAVKLGLDRETAIELAIDTIAGSAELAATRSGEHSARLKDEVASPGGTTIYGLAELERQGFRSALIEAVFEAGRRSKQLGSS